MALSYISFLKVSSSHNYYRSGIPGVISYSFSEATAKKLKNHRLKFNQYPGGFELSFQSADGSTPLVPIGELKLTFLIKLENALEFFNFTNLSGLGGFTAKKKLFFQNDPQNSSQITPGLIDYIKPNQFTYEIPVTTNDPVNETVSLELEHVESGEIFPVDDIPAKEDGTFETPIDLAGKPEGLYQFRAETSVNQTISDENILIDQEVYRQQIFGIVEIHYNQNSLNAYELVFERKSNLWNYILVNRTERTDFDSLEIKDNSLVNDPPYQTYLFEKQQTGFTVGNSPAVRFQSKTAIPFFELPKKNIELVKAVGNNDLVLMKNLANPPTNQISSNENESDIYVFV
ncbi:MAG: hypothetical protein AAFQ94_20835 [Bacteroidota bacterium]